MNDIWNDLKDFEFKKPDDAKNIGGGFELINNNRHLYPNPMHDPEIVKKNVMARIKNMTPERREKLAEVSRNNLKKAVEVNTGSVRPEHSKFMTEYNKKQWMINKEKRRDSMSSTFVVESPTGKVYNTNRLQEFCKERNLCYGSVWNTSRTGKPVFKGKAKGWICRKI